MTEEPQEPVSNEDIVEHLRKIYSHMSSIHNALYEQIAHLDTKVDLMLQAQRELIEALKAVGNGQPQPQGEEIWITGLVFREHINDDETSVLVVDCYPDWKGTKYGMYRAAFFYLDTDQDMELLENASGLLVEPDEHGFNLMLRDEETPLKRKPNQQYEYLYSLKDPAHPERHPFKVLKTDTGKTDSKGYTIYNYQIVR